MRRPLLSWLILAALATGPAAAQTGSVPGAAPRLSPRLAELAAPLFHTLPSEPQSRRLRGEKAPPVLDVVVLFCEFEDAVFYGREPAGTPVDPVYEEIQFAARDEVYYTYHLGDVHDYFEQASGGDFDFVPNLHVEIVVLPRAMGWYGDHPEQGEQPVLLAQDVIAAADAAVDFSDYDTVLLIHAGAGEETDVNGDSPEQIYSTYLDPETFTEARDDGLIENPWLPADIAGTDTTRINQVLVLPETAFQDGQKFGSLGIYCFEIGQRLGMLPLGFGYRSWGIGSLGLMGWGLYAAGGWNPPHPCPYNKLLMGWLDPVVVKPGDPLDLVLTPASDPSLATACAKVEIGGGEYWLVEYRLQDPDGNRRWSFGDDRNTNGSRDFVDADAADGRPFKGDPDADPPIPHEKFDPDAGDVRELLDQGAEWDFQMTFNGDRPVSEDTGLGSGIYIWHVDEGVIQASLAAGTRLVNWDPARKGIDVEEADRVQDMDSRASDFAYSFGHEGDAFRGPEASFGPDTRPRTDTATGAPTEILFSGFSEVLKNDQAYPLDPPAADGGLWGYEYVAQMEVTVERILPAAGPVRSAEREFPPGVDLRGSHVLLVDLDGQPDERAEIVLAGNEGQVFVLDGDLGDHLDRYPFAVGMRADTTVAWNLPPAAGDLDGDGMPDIVLTAPEGLYAFDRNGTPLRDPEAQAVGLYEGIPPCELPPVLVPVDVAAAPDPAAPVCPAVVVRNGAETRLQIYGDPGMGPAPDLGLGDVVVRSIPVFAFGRLWVAAADTIGGRHQLLACSPEAGATQPILAYDLAQEPGFLPPSWGFEAGGDENGRRWVAVYAIDGRGETVMLDADLSRSSANLPWPDHVRAHAAAANGALVGTDIFGRVGPAGDWENGWPQRPLNGTGAPDPAVAAGPLSTRLLASSRPGDQHVFPAPDGRLFAFGPRGEAEAGWPLAGPGPAAGTPALGPVTGDLHDDLVAVGGFARINSMDADTGELDTSRHSVVVVWSDVALTGGSWTMWGGSPWRNGTWDAVAAAGAVAGAPGSGIVSGSHICYPSPLTGSTLYVRARLRSGGRVRAHVYNLEGERVTTSAWRQVLAQSAFDVPVELGGAVSGMYLCRLEAESDAGGRDHSVVPFAISR